MSDGLACCIGRKPGLWMRQLLGIGERLRQPRSAVRRRRCHPPASYSSLGAYWFDAVYWWLDWRLTCWCFASGRFKPLAKAIEQEQLRIAQGMAPCMCQ